MIILDHEECFIFINNHILVLVNIFLVIIYIDINWNSTPCVASRANTVASSWGWEPLGPTWNGWGQSWSPWGVTMLPSTGWEEWFPVLGLTTPTRDPSISYNRIMTYKTSTSRLWIVQWIISETNLCIWAWQATSENVILVPKSEGVRGEPLVVYLWKLRGQLAAQP